ALRRDHAVDRVFEHQYAVRGRDRDGAARAALAHDDRDIRYAERKACLGRARDRFRLPAFLRGDARIGAGGVDQRDHRDAEAIGHFHQPRGLAVAFGLRHAEIVLEPAFGGRALFLADDADALAAEAPEAADDRIVFAELAVAGERREVGDELRNVVEAMRARRPARDLRLLPGGEIVVEFFQRLRRLGFEALDLLDDRHIAARLHGAQFLDLLLEFADRLFEVEIAAHRASNMGMKAFRRGRRKLAGGVPQVKKAPRIWGLGYRSASGCRSRTRLFRRSSSTCV